MESKNIIEDISDIPSNNTSKVLQEIINQLKKDKEIKTVQDLKLDLLKIKAHILLAKGNWGHKGRPGMRGGSGRGGGGGQEIPTGKKWHSHAEGMPYDTLSLHQKADGSFDPERQKLHEEIKQSFIKGVPSVPLTEKPMAVIMMGAPASGKSTMVQGLDKSKFVTIDSDEIKTKLPEYKISVNAGARDAANIVHEESSYLGKQVRKEAISNRQNIIYDGTGGNVDSYRTMIKDLKSKGYHVELLMPHAPLDIVLSRALTRAERMGRFVRPSIIKEVHSVVPSNFRSLGKEADGFKLYSTDNVGMKLVWSKSQGKEVIHDEVYVNQFITFEHFDGEDPEGY